MVNQNLMTGLISLTICILALNLLIFLPIVIDSKLKDELVLRPHSDLFDKWSDVKFPIYIRFYFFNVLNPNDVEFNSKKPLLSEVGPYTFLEKRNKNIFLFSGDNKDVVFKERRKYYFQPNLSVGRLDDGKSIVVFGKCEFEQEAN